MVINPVLLIAISLTDVGYGTEIETYHGVMDE
jgi:hypothetical protein